LRGRLDIQLSQFFFGSLVDSNKQGVASKNKYSTPKVKFTMMTQCSQGQKQQRLIGALKGFGALG
jgi:hypothetical protein